MPKFRYEGRENTPDAIAPGVYVLGVVAAEFRIAKDSGADMIELQLKPVFDEKGKKVEGPTVWDYLVFGEKSAWKIDVALKAFDCAPPVGTELDIDEGFIAAMLGMQCWAELIIDEYQGKKRNKVGQYITNLPHPVGRSQAAVPAAKEGDFQ